MKTNINNNQIKVDTGRALLVSLPSKKSSFWIPSSLVYKHDWYSAIYLPDDMIFNCVRGKTEKYTLIAKELYESLNDVLKGTDKAPQIVHHVPEEREAVKVDADDDLIR